MINDPLALEKQQFVSDVNWYTFLVTCAILCFVGWQFWQGNASFARLVFVAVHPIITFTTYRLSRSGNDSKVRFAHWCFCSYLVLVWNMTFVMNGGFVTPSSVWIIVAPLFIVSVLGRKAAVIAMGVSAIAIAWVLFAKFSLNISTALDDTIDPFTLGMFHIPAALLLAYFTVSRYSDANQSAQLTQERLLHSQRYFLTNMSHELRTPINGIYGVLQILGKKNTDPLNSELLEAATNSTQSLTNIINDILQAHQLDQGAFDLHAQWMDSDKLFANLRGLFIPTAQLKNILFSVKVNKDMPEQLYCDALRLGQVLNNITGNSLKFTTQGYVKVEASYNNDTLIIVISDTGIGMNDNTQANLFERFFQGDATNTKAYPGLGLGLSISKELLNKMGGTISLISQVGQGSTFTVNVPMPSRHTEQHTLQPTTTEGGKPMDTLRVLLVEDNITNQLTGKLILEQHVADIEIANHGSEALAKISASSFDLIITDISMPEMDGIELLAELTARGSKTPLIALTGNADQESIEKLTALGFKSVITKPVDQQQLLSAIEEAV